MLKFKSQNKDELRRQAILAGVIVVSAVAYAKHRKVVNAVISAQQDLAFESMWATWDNGVKYGIELAKEGLDFTNVEATKQLTKTATQDLFDEYFGKPA